LLKRISVYYQSVSAEKEKTMDEKRQSLYPQEDGETQSLIYESIEQTVDNYYVGTAYLKDTAGSGQFQVKVSGQKADIEKYSDEARFHEISLALLEPGSAPSDLPEVPKETDRKRVQRVLDEQCKAMKNLLDQVDDATLAKDELVYKLLQTKGRHDFVSLRHPDAAIDFRLDREIKILPLKLEAAGLYELKFRIHPSVAAGRSDFYLPSFELGNSASVNLQTLAGDPDLYLYRGGWLQAMSLRLAGYNESVSANGGSGSWSVKVYGYSAAQYEISSTWTFWYTG
jgi:hypothetical protein